MHAQNLPFCHKPPHTQNIYDTRYQCATRSVHTRASRTCCHSLSSAVYTGSIIPSQPGSHFMIINDCLREESHAPLQDSNVYKKYFPNILETQISVNQFLQPHYHEQPPLRGARCDRFRTTQHRLPVKTARLQIYPKGYCQGKQQLIQNSTINNISRAKRQFENQYWY